MVPSYMRGVRFSIPRPLFQGVGEVCSAARDAGLQGLDSSPDALGSIRAERRSLPTFARLKHAERRAARIDR